MNKIENKAYCETCDHKTLYLVKHERVTRKIKDIDITLEVDVPHCAVCDDEVYVKEVSDRVQQEFFDVYRQKNNIPNVQEIIEIREKIGLNQRDFSKLLGFGEITISRYETGSVPNKINTSIILSAKDKEQLSKLYETNKNELSPKGRSTLEKFLAVEDNFKGNSSYKQNKFFDLTYLFINASKDDLQKMSLTKLNKLLFYTDFNAFRKLGQSITGSMYMKMNYGPVPCHYEIRYNKNPYIEINKTIDDRNDIRIIKSSELTHLSELEKKLALAVYSHFKHDNASYISTISHQEEAWLNVEMGAHISYTYANSLNIKV